MSVFSASILLLIDMRNFLSRSRQLPLIREGRRKQRDVGECRGIGVLWWPGTIGRVSYSDGACRPQAGEELQSGTGVSVARLFDRSTTLVKIVEDTRNRNLGEIVARFLAVGLKVSEALGGVSRDRDEKSLFNGLVVARLKRAMGELSRLLNMANRFKERGVELPVSIDEWIGELLEIREELLLLMNEFGRRSSAVRPGRVGR